MAVKWIIADVDGCLLPEESVAWDLEPLMELARRLRQSSPVPQSSPFRHPSSPGPTGAARPRMTLCTGRPQPYVEALVKLLDIQAPVICESGAVLYTLSDNRSSYFPTLTPDDVNGLRALRAFIETDILPDFPDALFQFGKEAHLSIFSEKPEIFEAIRPRVAEFAARRGGPEITISPSHYYLNIALAKATKGRAIEYVAGLLGVGAADLAGIGDTEGDLPMREAVGYFACPANASDAIKRVADYVSPHPTIHGVLDILSRPEFGLA